MVSKEQTKEEIKKLIKISKDHKEYITNEEQTCTSLILPFFKKVLGWDTEKPYEFRCQKSEGGKRIDYVVLLDGISQFIIEAKALNKEIIDVVGYYRQAKDYTRQKDKLFAILTNFRHFIILRDVEVDNPLKAQINEPIDIEKISEEQFELLWNFSKEVWSKQGEQGMASKYMAKVRRRKKIDEELLDYMKKWRLSLLNNLKKFPRKNRYDFKDEKEVGYVEQEIQRFIDRLVFICYCEDKEIYEKKLRSRIIEKTERYSGRPFLLKKIRELFKEYNNKFDSDLFDQKGYCDQFYFDDAPILNILKDLRESTSTRLAYNFDVIEADILGKAYENFIGHLLEHKWRKFREEKNGMKRKREGIYYTPQYIVNYIVKNTVRDYIKNKSFEEIKKVKILDPACGSGSFLLRVFDVLVEECSKKLNRLLKYEEKQELLLNCIFGVDKDERACDIAKLNFSLKLAERGKKLPELYYNIRCGDSLIDDERVVGYKAFKWEEQFKDIMQEGGFDVVIGNPPYVKARDTEEPIARKWMEKSDKYESLYKMWDLYIAFVERGLKLLKPNGYFAMIIPDTIGEADYTSKLVDMILKNYSLYQIDFFPKIKVFEGVGVSNKIIFVKNSLKIKKCLRVLHYENMESIKSLGNVNNESSDIFKLTVSKIDFRFSNTLNLDRICYVSYGARFNSDKYDKIKFKKKDLVSETKDKIHNKIYTEGKFLERYQINKELYVEWGTERCPKRLVRPTFPELYSPQKILMSRQKRIAAYSDKGHICDNTIIVGVPYFELKNVKNRSINKYIKNIAIDRKIGETVSKQFDIKFLISIINSKLMQYFLKFHSRSKLDSYPDDWKKIPIKNIPKQKQIPLIKMADKMLTLNNRLKELGGKITNEKVRIEKEIEKLDQEIDKEIYKLYGITVEEKEIVEKSLK